MYIYIYILIESLFNSVANSLQMHSLDTFTDDMCHMCTQ